MALGAVLALPAAGQAEWRPAFGFHVGAITGGAKDLVGSRLSFGGAFELDYQLSKGTSLVFDVGYRWYPGDFVNVSFIPTPLPIRAAAGTYYESTRVRKTDGQGMHLTALYRKAIAEGDWYWQAGLRVARNKTTETTTGTRLTITVATAGTAGSATAVGTILTQLNTTKTSFGPVVGAGFRFMDRYSLELNLSTLQMESPASGSKSGVGADISFGIRF